MIDLPYHDDGIAPSHSATRRFLLQEWPYLLMLALLLIGVGYTGFSNSPIRTYWMVLAPIVGAICVATAWPKAIDRQDRLRLIWTQALHWGAVLVAMELIYLTDAAGMMTAETGALAVLTLLALGTFVAGIHLPAWKITLVGVVLALAVPGIVLLERSAMFVLLIGVAAVAVIVPVWWASTRSRPEPSPAAPIDPAFAPHDPTAPPRDPLADPRL
uniref:Uncharacterized protein n=1 Tax=Rhodopseudomonas palustris (strain BisA53) TaxID=316055 RepID=Q07HT1_RHOP5